MDHLNPTLVDRLRYHLITCPIRHLSWCSVSCSSQSFTIQMSFLHKCDQESGYNEFNMVVAAFPYIFLCSPPPPFFFHIHKTHPHLLTFLEGSSSYWDTNLRYASHIRERFSPQTFLQVSFTYEALRRAFTNYWQSPQTF